MTVANYTKVDAIAAADIVKINGVAKGSIVKCGGATTPASGATRWVCALDDGYVGYADPSDLTSWTTYDHVSGTGHPAAFDICAGKNAAGQTIYVMSRDSVSMELLVSGTDVTSTSDWTSIDLGTGDQDQIRIIWFDDGSTAGVWLAVGRQTSTGVFRSTDGAASWSNVALSGLTDHNTGRGIQAMDYGNGVVMLAQADSNGARIYTSTDNGASFSVSEPFTTNVPTAARALTYTKAPGDTNGSWALICGRGGELRIRTCSDADLTDWGNEYTPDNLTRNPDSLFNEDAVVISSHEGRVVHITTRDRYVSYFDVSGKTVSNLSLVTLDMNSASNRAEDIANDANGTWIIAARSGDIWRSTNNGEAWSKLEDDIGGLGDDAQAICSDVLTVI